MEIIVTLLVITAIGLLIWNLVLHDKLKTNHSENECDKQNISDDIEKAVSSLLRVVDKTNIIEELRYERSCKRDLIEEVKSLIFFKELQDVNIFYNRLKQKEKSLSEKPWNVPEHQALAKMYHELVCYAKHHIKKEE